jgi:hypothetical protein
MLQVRLMTDAKRQLVLEFRPRGRRLGDRIADALADDPERSTTSGFGAASA